MEFDIRRTERNTWLLTPRSGRFSGVEVAEVEGVSMKSAVSVGRTLTGHIKALWGATILDERVYEDRETMRGLAICGVFSPASTERMRMDFDGLCDSSNRAVKKVVALCAFGPRIYARAVTLP